MHPGLPVAFGDGDSGQVVRGRDVVVYGIAQKNVAIVAAAQIENAEAGAQCHNFPEIHTTSDGVEADDLERREWLRVLVVQVAYVDVAEGEMREKGLDSGRW